MRGQLYRGHTNATALSSSLVVSALGSESDDPGPSPGRGKALCPWDVREKKMRAPLLGLVKSIYYLYLPKLLPKIRPMKFRTITSSKNVKSLRSKEIQQNFESQFLVPSTMCIQWSS